LLRSSGGAGGGSRLKEGGRVPEWTLRLPVSADHDRNLPYSESSVTPGPSWMPTPSPAQGAPRTPMLTGASPRSFEIRAVSPSGEPTPGSASFGPVTQKQKAFWAIR